VPDVFIGLAKAFVHLKGILLASSCDCVKSNSPCFCYIRSVPCAMCITPVAESLHLGGGQSTWAIGVALTVVTGGSRIYQYMTMNAFSAWTTPSASMANCASFSTMRNCLSSRCLQTQSAVVALSQRCTTFLGQGPQCIIFSALEGRRQNYELKFHESSIKKPIFKNVSTA